MIIQIPGYLSNILLIKSMNGARLLTLFNLNNSIILKPFNPLPTKDIARETVWERLDWNRKVIFYLSPAVLIPNFELGRRGDKDEF
jgi:hypothetical protein